MNALQKSLELKFDSATFERAQKVAQQAIDETAKAAETLRARLAFLEQSGNANTTAYKKLQTELAQTELRAKQLEEQLDKINKIKFDAIAKNVSEVGNAISTAGRALTPFSAAAAGAITGLGALGVSTAATGAEIDDLSNRFGVSAETIQELQFEHPDEGDCIVWQTEVINVTLSRTIAADKEIEQQYPSVIQNLTERVEQIESVKIINGGQP